MGGEEEVGGEWGRVTIISIYYVKKLIFNQKTEKKIGNSGAMPLNMYDTMQTKDKPFSIICKHFWESIEFLIFVLEHLLFWLAY